VRELAIARRLDREAAEELGHHVETMVARKMASGLSEQEARRLTRIELGDPDLAREDLREGRTGFVVEQSLRDIRFAGRILRRSPASSLLAIVTIGLGIGASTALFSLLSTIVLRPLPYPDPDRLVRVYDTNAQTGMARAGIASGNIDDWRRRSRAFDGITGFYAMGRTLTLDTESRVVLAAQVTQDFFPVMRVAPVVGSLFTASDFARAQFNSAAAPIGADPVVIVSHRVWRQDLGGDPGVIGRAITLERRPFRVVGVLPEGFAIPAAGVDLWLPWNVSDGRPRDQHYLGGIARLRPGVSLADADADLNAVARQLANEFPATNRGWGVALVPLQSDVVGGTAPVLWLLFGSVGLVLLIACGNVALLTLIRGLDRSDESNVRLALGASRGALLRSALIQSGVVAACGGLLGVATAIAALRLLPIVAPDLPRLREVSLDPRALAFAFVITAVAALLSGLPHALGTTRVRLASGSRAAGDRSRHRWRDVLVAGQIAIAVVLLAGAGLLVRSYLNLSAADSGVDPRGVLVAPVFLDSQAYTTGTRTREYYRTLFERLAALPGVEAVGGATTVPGSPLGPDFDRPVWPEGSSPDAASRQSASVRMVTPGFFGALRIPIEQGRAFDDRDTPDSPRVVMVSDALARRLWPGQSAVGQRLVMDYSTQGTYSHEVVGVAGDLRFKGPRGDLRPEVYIPHAQRSYLVMHVVLRTSGDPRALVPAVRETMRAVDAQKPAQSFQTLDDLLGSTYARDRQVTSTLVVFAVTATLLATLGVYGALAQRVRERSREIGIRIALGADGHRVAAWVGTSAARLLATGLGAGLLIAWICSGSIRGVLFGVAPTDPVTAAGVIVLLSAVGVVAALVPAWRATRIDPVTTLRRP
jgi:predicted permease